MGSYFSSENVSENVTEKEFKKHIAILEARLSRLESSDPPLHDEFRGTEHGFEKIIVKKPQKQPGWHSELMLQIAKRRKVIETDF